MFLMYFYQKQFSIYARDLLKFSKEKSKEKGGGFARCSKHYWENI